MAFQVAVIKATSLFIRLFSILFFRYIPARLPSAIFTLFAIYAPLFARVYATTKPSSLASKPGADDAQTASISRSKLDADAALASQSKAKSSPHISADQARTARKSPSPWRVLLYGVPSAKHPLLSAITFSVNLLLVVLTVDALYRARWYYDAHDLSIVRLGYVSPNEASFFIREVDPSKIPVLLEIRTKTKSAASDAPWQQAGRLEGFESSNDFTGTVKVSLSEPGETQYEWRSSNKHAGEFRTPPKPGVMPKHGGGKFTFISTSCILPNFPYNPLDHALSIPGLRHLAAELPHLMPQFVLFLGDFIYIDVPQRFGISVDEYRMQYRQVYASPDWASVGQNLSWIHVLDDHEISNDWSANSTGVYRAAVEAWDAYQASVNPPRLAPADGGRKGSKKTTTWFEFVQGPASFFMLDTRSYRSSNDIPFNESEKTMLGREQLQDLLAWLARPEADGVKWKIIASSVPFTKNWPINVQDTWGGFLVERRKVLEAMWDAGARGVGVVILSGDRHEFAATKFPPESGSRWSEASTVYEFSTSPLNQFASPFPTYKQTDGQDVMMKYIPSGTSKFGAFIIEDVAGESRLEYRLYINGRQRWTTRTTAPSTSR